jgi:adenylate kinase family enzyme
MHTDAASRIAILGSGGTGKSTLTRELASLYHLPTVHWDGLYWKPGWIHTPENDWLIIVTRELAKSQWIADGDLREYQEELLARAQVIIFLDFNRWLCILRVIMRRLQYWRRVRPDTGPGCYEEISWQVLKGLWVYPIKKRPQILRNITRFEGSKTVFIFKNPRELERFIRSGLVLASTSIG